MSSNKKCNELRIRRFHWKKLHDFAQKMAFIRMAADVLTD
jgi:hypothetical protein